MIQIFLASVVFARLPLVKRDGVGSYCERSHDCDDDYDCYRTTDTLFFKIDDHRDAPQSENGICVDITSVGVGGTCSSSGQCADDYKCYVKTARNYNEVNDVWTKGSCVDVTSIPQGADCNNSGQCADDYKCYWKQDGQYREFNDNSSLGQCTDVTSVPVGGPCNNSGQCADDYKCYINGGGKYFENNDNATPGVCTDVTSVPVGGPCNNSGQCADDYKCYQNGNGKYFESNDNVTPGICTDVTSVPVGGPCNNSGQCADDYKCYINGGGKYFESNDNVTPGICTDVTSVPVGGPCNNSGQCADDYKCYISGNGKYFESNDNVSPGICTDVTSVPVGGACNNSGQCADDYKCYANANGKFWESNDNNTPGICTDVTSVPVGGACNNSGQCADDYKCYFKADPQFHETNDNSTPGVCTDVTQVNAGDPCNNSRQCAKGLRCGVDASDGKFKEVYNLLGKCVDRAQIISSETPRCVNGACAIISDLKVDSNLPDTYTGARFNLIMGAYIPNIMGTAVEADNLNEGITDSYLGIYAQYQIFTQNSTTQTIIIDAYVEEGDCPQGYVSGGQITSAPDGSVTRSLKNFFGVFQDSKNCKNHQLCLLKVPVSTLKPTDTIVTSIAISSTNGDPWNPDVLTWNVDMTNMHEGSGCGDSFDYRLVLQRDAAFPQDSTKFSPELKKSMILEHAPLIVNHPDESYHPSSLSYFLDGTDRVFDNDQKYWYLKSKVAYDEKLQTFDEPFWKGTADLSQVPVYAYYLQRSPTVADVVYSAFYPFNYGKKVMIAMNTAFGHHVGDMEHVAVRFINGAPAQFGIQRHSFYDQYYINSPKLNKVGSQTKVWQAKGSHGMWPESGSHTYMSVGVQPLNGVKIDAIDLTDDCADGPIWDGRKRIEAFDVSSKQPLPGNTEFTSWPQVLENNGVDNSTLGTSNSRSGPVKVWGDIWKGGCLPKIGQCKMEEGPDGAPFKSWWTQNTLRD